jgi:hypothetical protein
MPRWKGSNRPAPIHILEMNGESYRLKASRRRQGKPEIPTNAS